MKSTKHHPETLKTARLSTKPLNRSPQKTRAGEAALIPWIELAPRMSEGEVQGKLNQARTAERALHDS
jgi:hypothetical protein